MKDYYKLNQEIIICNTTIDYLQSKKDRLFINATNTTSHLKDEVISGGKSVNSIELYVEKIDEIDNELTEKEEELKELLLSRGKIEEALKNIAKKDDKGLEKIFVLKYVEGVEPKQIAEIIPCDLSTVYRKLKTIKSHL